MDTRKAIITEMLKNDEQLQVRELAERFSVSQMTIRRDLDELEKQGFLIRTHGGAVSTGKLRFIQSVLPEFEVSKEKTAIGRTAAAMVKPGQTIMVDTGTTTMEVARNLPQDSSVTVVTTSLAVAQDLYRSSLKVLLLGGFLRSEFPSVYGPLTEKLLDDINVDVLFIGCDGANSSDGFYSDDLHIASLERGMIRIAEQVIVVTESTKFGRRAFSRYAAPEQVKTVVTDTGLSSEDQRNLEERGVYVLIAEQGQ